MSKNQTTKLLSISPVLAAEDVRRDVDWYENKLGFKNVYDSSNYQKGPIDYAVICRDGICLHLQMQFPEDMISTDVKFVVDNIEPLYNELVENDVIKPEALNRQTPWNTSEFTFFDLSRNRITFLQDL